MTLYAVFSDIHANYAALTAAVRDARAIARREHDDLECISLGDVVDYGPQPNECVAWVQRYACITIQGNHDGAAAEPLTSPPLEIDQNLWPILLWTRAELHDRHKQMLRRWRDHRGESALLSSFTPFHSDIDESGAYLNTPRAAKRTLQHLKTPYGLFGHTHVQGYFVQTDRGVSAALAGPVVAASDMARTAAQLVPIDEWISLPTHGQRVILNPGSVGQPRQYHWHGTTHLHRDYRAAYMLLRQRPDQQWEFRFQRVDYSVAETVRLLRNHVRWQPHLSQIDLLASEENDVTPPSSHPFIVQLYETLASMDTLLPTLVERIIQQLVPAEAPPHS